MSSELTYSAFESRYRNKQYIGSGGFAKVYKVFDHAKNHYVALKVADVRPEWKKFTLKNEVELVNKLPFHRNIARYDACYRFNTGFTGEMDFAVLRFYEYGNLEQFLSKQEMTLEDRRLIIQGILEGTAFLHRNNVIHRDLKSQNILLHREDGVWTPKITDFGLSREILGDANITNSAIGLSYAYAAPEQIQNKRIYKNVDLWAIGIIIYRVIADELPFKGRSDGQENSTESQLEISRKIINLELPEKLNTIQEPYQTLIRKCLVLEPLERAQTAEELIRVLNGDRGVLDATPPVEPLVETENIDAANSLETPISELPTDPDPDPVAASPPVELNEKTEVIPPPVIEENVLPSEHIPPAPEPIPVENYKATEDDIPPIVEEEKSPKEIDPPIPKPKYQPMTGDPPKSYKWAWVLLALFIGGVAIGFWWWNQTPENSEITIRTDDPDYISTGDSAQENNEDRFEKFDEEIEKVRRNDKALAEIETEVQQLIDGKNYSGNYRLHYLVAKIQAYEGGNKNRKSIISLREAAAIAIQNEAAATMLSDIKNDEQAAFKKLKKIGGGNNWNKIIQALETSIQ